MADQVVTSTASPGPGPTAWSGRASLPSRLSHLAPLLRPRDTVCAPTRLGAARMTRHSFAPAFLRYAVSVPMHIEHERWELDADGCGEAVYRIDLDGQVLRFVVFSTTIPAEERGDRVVSKSWDVTAALIEGDLDEIRRAELRREVPLQEAGRADARTLVWTRANRSERFFDYVIGRLAAGRQPEYEMIGPCAYVLRSTAFYGNGKFGMAPFAALRPPHPLSVPYRAQMLAAWLLREFSLELVEHVARVRNPDAVGLSETWGRYLGLGNATGLGMVPFFAMHPAMFDAWCKVRELALAHARTASLQPDDGQVAHLERLCDRSVAYLDERHELASAPFAPYGEVAADLRRVARQVSDYAATGRIDGIETGTPWDALWRWAEATVQEEAQELLLGLLSDLDDCLDADLEALLTVDESTDSRPSDRVAELRELIADHYRWIDRFEVGEPATAVWAWYYSADNEEPRRAGRGEGPATIHEMAVDIPRQVHRLRTDLDAWPASGSVAEFLLAHPRHRGIVERIQTFHMLPYAEVHDDLLGERFLPLQIQRFKLATYGMANYVPQSTDWVRVTLYQGAPRVRDVTAGIVGDWTYPLRPAQEDHA